MNKKLEGFADVGDIVGLEVNIRTPGGYSPDMHNYANSVNMYQIYADTVAGLNPRPVIEKKYYCANASRRDGVEYFFSDEDIKRTYAKELVGSGRMPDVLSGVMGNYFYMARFNSVKEVELFHEYVNRRPQSTGSHKNESMFKKDKCGESESFCDTHIDGA